MDKQDELERLRERALSLNQAIQDLDYDVERAVHSAASGSTDTGRAISMVRDRHNHQLGLMYDLGKVEAQIADLENRVREQDERGEEQRATQEWQAELPVAQEDHLDWLRPVLDAPETAVEHGRDERHPHHEGEERMLTEMQREDLEPDDYLDWWRK
jgi:predicted  nucleic acid-binding Zn-ribbon protein